MPNINTTKEEEKRSGYFSEIKGLVKSNSFQELLKVLALKVRELDTVRDIDDNISAENIAIEQMSKKKAIEIIESWLAEVCGIINFSEFGDTHIEKQDDVFKILEDEKNK